MLEFSGTYNSEYSKYPDFYTYEIDAKISAWNGVNKPNCCGGCQGGKTDSAIFTSNVAFPMKPGEQGPTHGVVAKSTFSQDAGFESQHLIQICVPDHATGTALPGAAGLDISSQIDLIGSLACEATGIFGGYNVDTPPSPAWVATSGPPCVIDASGKAGSQKVPGHVQKIWAEYSRDGTVLYANVTNKPTTGICCPDKSLCKDSACS